MDTLINRVYLIHSLEETPFMKFHAGLVNFTSILESILLNRSMLNFSSLLEIIALIVSLVPRECKQAIISSQEDKQGIQFKEGAKNCCKEKIYFPA